MLVKERPVSRGYDNFLMHHTILLDLPFQEGSGVITRDAAKPHHQDVTLVGAPTWVTLATGTSVLRFNGATNYLWCPAAATADLDFTTEDYSIAVPIYPEFSAQSKMVIARYGTDLDGWEGYLFDSGAHHYLTLRHHHASLAPDTRDGCYSDGWENNTWWLMGISRIGLYPLMYRNGLPVEMTYDAGGLKDPDTCNRDLVIGCRYTKNADWYKGMMGRPRIFFPALADWEWKELFHMESSLFGL